jgi:hypothetical protein
MRNTKKGRGRKETNRFADLPPIALPKELELASSRIGDSSVRRLKWLVNFAALGLDGLSQGQRSDLGWEIKAFLFPSDIQSAITKWGGNYGYGYASLFALIVHEPLDRGAISVEKFQAFTKSGLESAFHHGGWEFTYPRRTEKVSLMSKEGEVAVLWFDRNSPTQAFEITVFDLIKAERERLGLCGNERCRKPFVTEKKHKGKFCSPRCSAYVRTARFRGKKGLRGAP